MREPLRSFAERMVRNDEISEFIDALIEAGAPLETLTSAVAHHRYTFERPGEQLRK